MIAWSYEHDGLRPMMVGHSQGGMQVVKVLHNLAGTFAGELPVWNPVTDSAERRTAIVDPYTRAERPVIGTQVSFASAVGAGGPSGVLPNQWAVIGRLREVPDTAVQFNGYFLGIDWFTMSLAEPADRYHNASGKVLVRNVVLPAGYLHVSVPVSHHLPDNPAYKRYVDDYTIRFTPRQPKSAYSFESRPRALAPAFVWRFRANQRAWRFFEAQPPWYRRTSSFWLMSAKPRHEPVGSPSSSLFPSASRGFRP